jgi:hypothetical protein
VHGLEEYGLPMIGHGIHHAAEAVAHAVPAGAGIAEWLVTAAGAGLVGLVLGAALIPLTGMVLAPAWTWVSATLRPQKA